MHFAHGDAKMCKFRLKNGRGKCMGVAEHTLGHTHVKLEHDTTFHRYKIRVGRNIRKFVNRAGAGQGQGL